MNEVACRRLAAPHALLGNTQSQCYKVHLCIGLGLHIRCACTKIHRRRTVQATHVCEVHDGPCLLAVQVVLARAVETGAVVALKRIAIRTADGLPDNVARELRSLQSVQHFNVVSLLDVFAKVRRLGRGMFSGWPHVTCGVCPMHAWRPSLTATFRSQALLDPSDS